MELRDRMTVCSRCGKIGTSVIRRVINNKEYLYLSHYNPYTKKTEYCYLGSLNEAKDLVDEARDYMDIIIKVNKGSPLNWQSDLVRRLKKLKVLREEGGSTVIGDFDLMYLMISKYTYMYPSGTRLSETIYNGIALRPVKELNLFLKIWGKKGKWPSVKQLDYLRAYIKNEIIRNFSDRKVVIKRIKINPEVMELKAIFDPPLEVGEFISFGYRLKIKNHYALTKDEAIKRYGAPFSSEGLMIRGPTLRALIEMTFPKGFKYEFTEIASFLYLHSDQPMDKVKVDCYHNFDKKQDKLVLELFEPTVGMNYNIIWYPP
ncbi:hypothetical protein BFU36_13135 [Sulfolobus sp. A20]|uniref:hypothetical protein n=3 Tax=Sulfolobaceae TaxID=118883 RepID=UPI000845FF46|nr:hypothetical protein [Sulfolobus sp. A20]TRM75443.1 hypothetical protein DJ532_10170 [Sulfolobus sp. A20-N-F8]TRM76212.1 hypothetical protein DJ523_01505 [Sulfolobus sp. E5]TRM78463.1 hypothetical protein DJ528_04855 [Sulfolobus sp. B5]TRM82494.1 hypothetical protein DJ524_00400 [Sulfolobus sp. D5]TRM82938.1 hypothetical protein DJ531_07695 [Sulfolobus sp. A20-N-F6]TRM88200.1 hypothetical protein DJ529_06005 [Sulfolobus sp. C3]TRM94618.1 hypothetical protein DJ526_02090 [Sulfolobus sp. A2